VAHEGREMTVAFLERGEVSPIRQTRVRRPS